MVALLLLLGHGWIILAWRRRLAIEWSIWATAGVLPLLPLLWLGSSQRNQVAHIRDVGFDSTPFYLTTVFGSVAIGTLLLLLAMFSLPLRYPASIYLAWAALPVVALLLVSLVVPLFLPRYLLFTLPAWALLAGTALARLRFPWAIGALVLIAALGVSAHVALRQADGHDEATREAAAVISEQTKPGDGVVYADSEFRGGWTTRDTVAHYVPAEHRPKDLLLTRPPRTDGKLLAGECDDIGRCLGDTQRVWVFRLGEHTDPLRGIGPKKEEALRNGYRVEQTWHRTNVTLALLVRDPTGR